MKHILAALICFIALKAHAEQYPGESVAESSNTFAFDLYHQVNHKEKNVFFSPFSITTALTMTLAGAAGETEKQMSSALKLKSAGIELNKSISRINSSFADIIKNTDIKLSTANSLWIQSGYKFLDSYLSLIKEFFDAELKDSDFNNHTDQSRKSINQWVEDKTNGKIKDLLKPGTVKPDTFLVLVNAIYFLGKWDEPFEPARNKEGDFHLPDNNTAKATYMNKLDHFMYSENTKAQVVEIPYQNYRIVMNIILPKENTLLDSKELNIQSAGKYLSELKSTKVSLSIPKFKTESSFSLPDSLKALGIKDAFEPLKADFSGLNGNKDFFIGDVIHKAFVEVDESGTEAAAATAVVARVGSAINPNPPVVFKADHPFLFLIREPKSGIILFMGRINKPEI